MSSDMIKTLVIVIGFIVGGVVWAVTNFPNKDDVKAVIVTEIAEAEHVPAAEFNEYLEQQQIADEREYVLDLKEQIREIRYAMRNHPDDPYFIEELEKLEAELCEYREEECEDE
jgi:hypothetical protein